MSRWQPLPVRSRWQRQQDVDHGRKRAARDVGDQRRRHHRPVRRTGLERQQAGATDVVEIVPGVGRARTGLSVACDRAVDQPRIDSSHRLVAESELFQDARPKLLNQNISTFKQRAKLCGSLLRLQIDRQAVLAAVEQAESRARSLPLRRITAHVVAARPLDLGHLGAGFRQHQRRQRARQQIGKVDDPDPRQRLRHRFAPLWNSEDSRGAVEARTASRGAALSAPATSRSSA